MLSFIWLALMSGYCEQALAAPKTYMLEKRELIPQTEKPTPKTKLIMFIINKLRNISAQPASIGLAKDMIQMSKYESDVDI